MKDLEQRIQFFYISKRFFFPKRAVVKLFLEKLIEMERKKLKSINFIFCSDEYLRKLNKFYLNHDYYTDILTFDLTRSDNLILAEIFISVPRVKKNSNTHGQSFGRELQRVMIHGVLHLCGYRDKTKNEIKMMRKMEDRYLQLLSKAMFHVKR